MRKSDQHKAKMESILGELRGTMDLAQAENRELTETEQTRFDEAEREFEREKGHYEREQRFEAREKWFGNGDKPAPIDPKKFSGDGEQSRSIIIPSDKAKGPFGFLGEQIQSVIRSCTPGCAVDKRLLEVRSPSGMSESVGFDGGFLVQQDFQSSLTDEVIQTGILASRVKRFPIGAGKNGIKLPMLDETSRATGSRNGGITAFWAGEGEQKTKSTPKFRMMELYLKKLVGLVPITDELLEDAIGLESWLRMIFANEFGFQLDNAIMWGSGLGQPLGFMSSAALITQADEATQAATVIEWANIAKMWARLSPYSESSAVWLYNKQLFPALATMQFDSGATAGSFPLFIPAGGASGSPYNTLLGRPLLAIEQASAPGTPGDLVLADLSRYIMIEKGGIQTAMSIHVRFEYDESMLRFVLRTDGQPMDRVPLTPFKGTDTTGAFVALDTRNGS